MSLHVPLDHYPEYGDGWTAWYTPDQTLPRQLKGDARAAWLLGFADHEKEATSNVTLYLSNTGL